MIHSEFRNEGGKLLVAFTHRRVQLVKLRFQPKKAVIMVKGIKSMGQESQSSLQVAFLKQYNLFQVRKKMRIPRLGRDVGT